ncbi:MAG: hypothetical protein E7677_02485 [Ruminococcaceae bacterium]|nr:hypothetical protein [Oscillospiraceae bacterium]
MKKQNVLRSVFTALLCLFIALSICSCDNGSDEGAETEAKYYKVTFNSSYGSDVPEQRVLEGEKATRPESPTRNGYVFKEWQYNGSDWNFSHKVTEDMTLVASWERADAVYVIENGYVTGCKQYFETMVVPSSNNGIPVVGIDDGAFASIDKETVRKIVLPESVSAIGNNAFKDCSDIEIEVNGALTLVGESAFENCNGLAAVKFGNELDNIPFNAFKGCSSLSSVILPASLTLISENAFEDCSSLAYLIIHSSTSAVENNAFAGCTALSAVYYHGTQEQFASMIIDSSNTPLTEATRLFYSKDKPTGEGNFWHYDDNGKIKLWK